MTGGLSKLSFAPLSLGTVQQDALNMSLEPVLSVPSSQSAPVLFMPQAGMTVGSDDCQATLVRDAGDRCQVRE